MVLIPCRQPPHKGDSADLASGEHRLAMCRLAVQGLGGWTVDDLEMARAGPSYTIDTARELRRRGWPAVHWLIGADMAAGLPTWHEADALMREVSFVVMVRAGTAVDAARHQVVATPMIDISATDIRGRVKAGKPIEFLTPAAVCDYIHQHRLYR